MMAVGIQVVVGHLGSRRFWFATAVPAAGVVASKLRGSDAADELVIAVQDGQVRCGNFRTNSISRAWEFNAEF